MQYLETSRCNDQYVYLYGDVAAPVYDNLMICAGHLDGTASTCYVSTLYVPIFT